MEEGVKKQQGGVKPGREGQKEGRDAEKKKVFRKMEEGRGSGVGQEGWELHFVIILAVNFALD